MLDVIFCSMKTEIEISDELFHENGGKIVYCVTAAEVQPHYDEYNYVIKERSYSTLSSHTIGELYEKMGQAVTDHSLYGEKNSTGRLKDGWDVEFSNIYIEVENYSKEKMRASKTFQSIGLARELKKKTEAAIEAANKIKRDKDKAERLEKSDREEYSRLRKKFMGQYNSKRKTNEN